MSFGDRSSLSGARKAAILYLLLGEDATAHIFRNLPEEDLQRVTEEVAKPSESRAPRPWLSG